MMHYMEYTDVHAYIEETFPYLLPYEAQNNLIIANVLKMKDTPMESALMLTVKAEDETMLLIGLMTPPFNLLLFEPENKPQEEAEIFLAQTLAAKAVHLPGVIGEDTLTSRFAKAYSSLTTQSLEMKFALNLYQLTQVQMPTTQVTGHLRPMVAQDIVYYPYWWHTFVSECHLPPATLDDGIEAFHRSLEKQTVYIWEEEYPVSTVAIGRKLFTGTCISQVYTPSFFRKKGYASHAVATLSQQLLDEGYAFVCLFADALNSTSNKIYTEMGYTFVCVYKEIMFKF